MHGTATCHRCHRSISMASDEFAEWVRMVASDRDLENRNADADARATCRDCLTPTEAEGYVEDVRRMHEINRYERQQRT